MRYFNMVFDGGFKLANSARELLDIMPTVERIHIMEFATPVDAYVRAYNEYQARSGGATVPTYEEMMTRPIFFKPDYVPPVIDYRCIYAVMHPWYVGIFIDEGKLVDVLERLPFAEVVEAVSIDDARAIIAYWYMCQHPMEVATYQRAPICPDLPLDVMMPVATTKWFEYLLREQYGMLFAPQATATLKLETPRDKELFEDLEEYELPVTTKLIVYQNGKPVV
ncbi:MAG: hypothetical protein IJL12_07195 [Selenomonadaceae bacterium]|nr:hypothetical protein [Selenomonadaceae bacterium]MBQ7493142.1 hypothetical protein [Selenomonadaceae bacterium]